MTAFEVPVKNKEFVKLVLEACRLYKIDVLTGKVNEDDLEFDPEFVSYLITSFIRRNSRRRKHIHIEDFTTDLVADACRRYISRLPVQSEKDQKLLLDFADALDQL